MSVDNFHDLLGHVGHDIECAFYGDSKKDALNVTVECNTCGTVLFDFDNPSIKVKPKLVWVEYIGADGATYRVIRNHKKELEIGKYGPINRYWAKSGIEPQDIEAAQKAIAELIELESIEYVYVNSSKTNIKYRLVITPDSFAVEGFYNKEWSPAAFGPTSVDVIKAAYYAGVKKGQLGE